MEMILAAFIAELRAIGLPVSLSENVDAAAALRAIPLADRAQVKSALATTLVKNHDHYRAFDLAFDIFFGGRQLARLSDGTTNGSGEASQAGLRTGTLLHRLAEDELNDLLFQAVAGRDGVLLRAVAVEAVDRWAGIEPGRVVAGTFYLYRTLTRLDLEVLRQRLRESAGLTLPPAGGPDGLSDLGRRLAEEDQDARVDAARAEVEAEIRRRLIADRDAQAVAATLRRPLPEDVEFLNASRAQLGELRQTVRPLARKMAARLAHKRRYRRRAALDFRRTVRKSLASGGVPVDLAFRKPRPAKPEIMLVADISGSVSAFAGFTMQLAYAMRSEFSRVRSFVFVDGIEEVTDILEAAADITAVTRRLNRGTSAVRFDGHSDYGMALETFWDRWGGQVRSRTSVIILGDGRNNYHASRAWVLTAIRQRARHLYWLNPEPAAAWDTGDSIMREYAPGCDLVVECRNLRQLRAFVEQLD
ncbi:MAG: vWA domain-containing protein [Streptosporangiaceae bacterium]